MGWLIGGFAALFISQGAMIWWLFTLEGRLRLLESRGGTVR